MKKEEIKRILFAMPEKLSLEEREEGVKFLMTILGIFFLGFFLFYCFLSEFKLNEMDALYVSVILLTAFSFLGIAFKKNIFRILKIFALLTFILAFIRLGASSIIVSKIGWLGFLGWLVYFIREMFYLIKRQ